MSLVMPKNRFVVFAQKITDGQPDENFDRIGSFRTISGLSQETKETEWKTGDMLDTLKIPGDTTYGKLILKKGVDNDMSISNWRENIFNDGCQVGEDYRTVLIAIIDRACVVQRVIIVKLAWPSKYDVEELDSMSSDALLESVELSHSGWKYDKTNAYIGKTLDIDTAGKWSTAIKK